MDCLFCKIIRKEIKSKIEYEDDDIVVIHDINPQAPVHLLILPKRHIDRISNMSPEDIRIAGQLVYQAKQVAEKCSIDHYRLVFNNGEQAGQSVFHIHLHLLGGRSMGWPPG